MTNNLPPTAPHPYKKMTMAEVWKRTEANDDYIRTLGYNLVVKTECQWYKQRVPMFGRVPQEADMTEQQVIDGIKDDSIFGMVEVDIEVDEEWKEHYHDLPPIFKNASISRDDIGDYMKDYAEQLGILKSPRRTLISSYFGKKITLITPLVKWYLRRGLTITKVINYINL